MSYKVIRDSALSRMMMGGNVLIVIAMIFMPYWGDPSWMRDFVEISCYFIFAMMWNLLVGYGGLISVGQQAYFGIGGYLMLTLADFAGINPFVAIPLAAFGAAIISHILSKIAFRLQGGYFAIGTWVISEVVRLTVSNISAVGGGSGTSLTAMSSFSRHMRENVTYWIALVCVTATIVGIYYFLRSKRGLALQAIRDNEVAAESQGISVARMKLATYIVAAFGCGLAGALFFVSALHITPDAAFNVNWSVFAIFIVVIGGLGQIEGPLVGSIVFYLLNKYFADYGVWYQIGLGLLAVVVVLNFKQGIWGWFAGRFGVAIFPTKRQLIAGSPK